LDTQDGVVPNSDPPAKDYPLSRARGQYRRVSGRWQLKHATFG